MSCGTGSSGAGHEACPAIDECRITLNALIRVERGVDLRLSIRKNKVTRRRELVVTLRRGEHEAHKCIRWIESRPHATLLACSCEYVAGARRVRLRYDVEGLTSLRGYLKRAQLSNEVTTNMLVSLAEALTCCRTAHMTYAYLLFDASHVFVGATGVLHFVFVPLDIQAAATRDTPLSLLEVLSTSLARTTKDPNLAGRARRLYDFVRSEEGAFSLNALHSFVREECKVDVRADGSRVLCSHGRSGRKILRRMATGDEYELEEGESMRLGRGGASDLRIQGNPRISRTHAGVDVKKNGIEIWDLGSKNGVVVDGRKLLPGERTFVPWGESFYLDDERMMALGPSVQAVSGTGLPGS